MKKYTLIYNPAAGKGNAKKLLPKIIHFFRLNNIRLDIYEAQTTEQATYIAKKQKNKVIIGMGGDGNINRLLQGIAGTNKILGIIPIGTTNVTALSLGIPLDVIEACKTIRNNKTKKIDIGKVNDKYFLFSSGIGFDAYVVSKASKRLKKLIGKSSYLISAFKALLFYKPGKFLVNEKKARFVIINNSKYYGGKHILAKDAKMDDGLFDVIIFKKRVKWNLLKILIGYCLSYIPDFSKKKDLELFKAKEIIIATEKPELVHTDAESSGTTPCRINIIQKGIKIFA